MAETSTCKKIGVDRKKKSFNYFALFDKIDKGVIRNQTEARMGKVRKIKRKTNDGLIKKEATLFKIWPLWLHTRSYVLKQTLWVVFTFLNCLFGFPFLSHGTPTLKWTWNI